MAATPASQLDPEKQVALIFAEPNSTPSGHSSHPHHLGARARDRIRHFLHPDGKRIHVASSPEEAIRLRTQLSNFHSQDEFDVYISGTPEHLKAVHQAREHHEARRDELREQHKDVYERFADVHAELDMLSGELERVTSHGVSLEAHFSKYGYNAHIKSYDEASPAASGTGTPRSSLDGSRRGSSSPTDMSAAERGYATPLKLFKRPVVRQYFHKGILWRASGSEEVQSFELFADLLYVGIIAINGDAAAEHPTGQALLQFIVTFTLSWKIWNDMALIISWFETDDIFQRVSVLFLLACLFGYTTNIMEAFDATYATLIGFYLAARLYMALYLILMAVLVPMIRPILLWHIASTALVAALWIGSVHLHYPVQLALIFIAMFVDIIGQTSYVFILILCEKVGGTWKDWCDRSFQFWPAINIEHRTERTNAFVTLVFGYTVVAMLFQSATNGITAFFGKAVLGLIQAFCFNWIYFEVDGANLHLHAIRRHKITSFLWAIAHLPFISAFVLGGGALSRLVVAHDTHGTSLEDLTETYHERSEEEVPVGVRWFYCAGFGIALACMTVISVSHVHKEIAGVRLRKRFRLAFRLAVSVVLICLPLATNLTSLELVGTVTGLIVLTLVTELWANSCCHDTLFARSKPCQYTGHCQRKDLEAMVKAGKEVKVEQLACPKTTKSGITVGPT